MQHYERLRLWPRSNSVSLPIRSQTFIICLTFVRSAVALAAPKRCSCWITPASLLIASLTRMAWPPRHVRQSSWPTTRGKIDAFVERLW
jgi:hypothetical protein